MNNKLVTLEYRPRSLPIGHLRGVLGSVTALYSRVSGSIPDGSSGPPDHFSLNKAFV